MDPVPPTVLPDLADLQRAANTPVQIGEVLADKYRVERVLGVGGMGVVVAATNLGLDQLVALKFMLPQALASADAVARFVREARAAVKLRSEHVGRVLDVGTLRHGAPYIVMEYLEGTDLSAVLQARGPLPVDEATSYVLQAIDAIAEAHSLGIVHRDLKPPNLFVARRNDGSPLVKVLDFGISKAKLSGENLTATTALMGSPGYMSPEQMRASREVDPRTDMWSLGVILYELVSGQLPFTGDTMPELCVKILQDPLPPLRQVAPAVPAAFEAVVARCMEKDRNRRFANVAELAQALEPFAQPREKGTAERAAAVLRASLGNPPAVTVVPDRGSTATPAVTTLGDASGQVGAGAASKRKRIAVAAVIGGLAAIGIVVAVAVRGGSGATSVPVAQPAAAPAATPAAAPTAAPTAGEVASDLVPPPAPVPEPAAAPPDAPAPAAAAKRLPPKIIVAKPEPEPAATEIKKPDKPRTTRPRKRPANKPERTAAPPVKAPPVEIKEPPKPPRIDDPLDSRR